MKVSVVTTATEEETRFDTVKKVLVYSSVVAGNHYCSKYILQELTRAVCEPTGLYGAVCMCKGCVNLQCCEFTELCKCTELCKLTGLCGM